MMGSAGPRGIRLRDPSGTRARLTRVCRIFEGTVLGSALDRPRHLALDRRRLPPCDPRKPLGNRGPATARTPEPLVVRPARPTFEPFANLIARAVVN